MNELWNLIPKGVGGWVLFFTGLFISPVVTPFIRDRISKPVAAWFGRGALWFVTWGFQSSRNSLYRDVARRKIIPAGVTIFVILACLSCARLGYSFSMYQNIDVMDGTYEEHLAEMTPEQIAKEGELRRENRVQRTRTWVFANIGGSAMLTLFFLASSIRQRIVANSIIDFEHRIALNLSRISLQEERELRASFASSKSYEEYLAVINKLPLIDNANKTWDSIVVGNDPK